MNTYLGIELGSTRIKAVAVDEDYRPVLYGSSTWKSDYADGIWTENTRLLDIEVLPSFWETPFAYFLYVLFVLLIIVTAVYILFTIYRLKHEVSVEQQMTNMKLRFFTDISHELRTPLTLISGPVEYVLANTQLPADAREQLQVVERNTNRMLRLINQILDFRKIQNKKMKMQVQRIDVVAFTRKIMENFDSVAEEHHIDFLFETEKAELYLWVDADKYEKIIFNLLSNAFKYTPNGKMIKLFIHEDEETVSIGVQDQGIGIAENKKKSIFVRFENLVDRNLFNPSTGIGLSLVKELVEMHKALISVDSKLGEGSCFKIDFMKGKEHYDEAVEFMQDDTTAGLEIRRQSMAGTEETVSPQPPAEEAPQGQEAEETSKGLMLLVEDNSELRIFLRSIFASEYRIVEAANGVEGLDKALKFLPDIIISDVMMPELDGVEMCRHIKNNLSVAYIPVVMLTAKDNVESQIEGYESGADLYIPKPFSMKLLEVNLQRLLKQREQWFKDCGKPAKPAAESSPAATEGNAEKGKPASDGTHQKSSLNPEDLQEMTEKLKQIIDDNLSNPNLSPDQLAAALGISRTKLYRDLKRVDGQSLSDYVRNARLEKAAYLLVNTNMNIQEVLNEVGFVNNSHFTKIFKLKYDVPPTEYKKKGK